MNFFGSHIRLHRPLRPVTLDHHILSIDFYPDSTNSNITIVVCAVSNACDSGDVYNAGYNITCKNDTGDGTRSLFIYTCVHLTGTMSLEESL